MRVAVVAGELDDAAFGRERAAQDRESAARLERVVDARAGPAGRRCRRGAAVSSRSVLPVHVSASTSSPASSMRLHEQAHAAGARHVDGGVAAARLEVGEHRRARRDRVEVVDRERHAGLVRDREQVEHARSSSPPSPRPRRSRSRTPHA